MTGHGTAHGRGAPRGLTPEEAQAWKALAATVTPLVGKVVRTPAIVSTTHAPLSPLPPSPPPPLNPKPSAKPRPKSNRPPPVASATRPAGLDGQWERRLKSGALDPDFTLDLHGHGLDAAYRRLDDGLSQARSMGARVVLLIAGKARPVEAADRAERRGAIRAKVLDWLAAGQHGAHIAAVRNAHRKHGGEGALYLVFKRER